MFAVFYSVIQCILLTNVVGKKTPRLYFPPIQYSGLWSAMNRTSVASFSGRDIGSNMGDSVCPGSPCKLVLEESEADYIVVPANLSDEFQKSNFASDNGTLIFSLNNITVTLKNEQQLILVCTEPWCSSWALQPRDFRSRRVGRTIGYHRGFDYWWPIACREWLWLSKHKKLEKSSLEVKRNNNNTVTSRISAFISNCDAKHRLAFLEALQKIASVDSFGACSHSRDIREVEQTLISQGFSKNMNSQCDEYNIEYLNNETTSDEFWVDYNENKLIELEVFRHRKVNTMRSAGYTFQLVAENTNMKEYISEKLIDALLSNTIPIYFGAPNVKSIVGRRVPLLIPRELVLQNRQSKGDNNSAEPSLEEMASATVREINRLLSDSDHKEIYKLKQTPSNLYNTSPIVRRCFEMEKLGASFKTTTSNPETSFPFVVDDKDQFQELLCAACAASQSIVGNLNDPKHVLSSEYHYIGCFYHTTQRLGISWSSTGLSWYQCKQRASLGGHKWFAMEFPHGYSKGISNCLVGSLSREHHYDSEGRADDENCEFLSDDHGHYLGGNKYMAVYHVISQCTDATCIVKDRSVNTSHNLDTTTSDTHTNDVTKNDRIPQVNVTIMFNDKPIDLLVKANEQALERAKKICWEFIKIRFPINELADCVDVVVTLINSERVTVADNMRRFLLNNERKYIENQIRKENSNVL